MCDLAVGDDGSVALAHHLVHGDRDGTVVADRELTHVYSLRDGLIARMDITESPA